MRRRSVVILVSVGTLVGLAVFAVASVVIGLNTRAGREQIRQLIQQQVGGGVNGKVYVGNVSGGLLSSISIDSFAIRGADDSIFISTGKVTLEYNPRDLIDRRLLIRNVIVEHPYMRLEKFPSGDWNHWRIFRRPPSNRPKVPGRGFGDFVVLDSVTVRNGTFLLIKGWTPPDSLTGARRDSAVRVALRDTTREIRRSSGGYTHVQRWSSISAFMPHMRLNHPDSQALGREFIIDRMNVTEQEPPFKFSNARGTVRHLGDSVFIDLPHFDLPASSGSASGKIFWGSGLPDRWDVRIRADSVSLRDIAWVYPTLPRIGGGRTNLHIHNSVDNLNVMEYALTDLDVRSEKSRLTGAMTFAVGNPVLGIKDLNLRLAPINFDMIRALSGGPFPIDWQGDLVGMVQGPGGPLTHFVVDTANITWRDDHVRGAVSRFALRGELDILQPAFTVFHGFHVATDLVDLRSIQYLYPGFPKIGGTMSGSATLDSSWLDLRFSDADLSHTNGPETPSHVTGKGRVTFGEKYMKYDVDLDAKPISMPQMSRVYHLGLAGMFSGPIKAKGTSANLRLTADLIGAGGRITYDGNVDVDGLSVGAHGAGRVETLQVAELVSGYAAPNAWLTGDYRVDIAVDTSDFGTLKGGASMTLERSEFGEVRIFPSRIATRFTDRKLFIDTLRLESTAATIDATGALGLTADRPDSVQYTVQVDSLGGLRQYAQMLLTRAPDAPPDSLSGSLSFKGWMHGGLSSFRLAGDMQGSNVVLRLEAGREIGGAFDVTNPFSAPTGTISLRSKTIRLFGVALDSVGLALRLNEGRTGAFTIGARETNGVSLTTQGEFSRADSATLVLVRSLALVADRSRWLMSGNSGIRIQNHDVTVDSLVLLNERGGRLALSATVPDTGRVRFLLRADSLPLRDIGVIGQFKAPLSGWATLTVTGAGTTRAPVINAEARFSNMMYDSLRLDAGLARIEYATNRANVALDLSRGTTSVLQMQGTLPVAVRYFGATLLDDSLQATIRTEGATLDLVQALIPGVHDGKGKLLATIDVAGTWKHPDVTGSINVANGEATIDQLGIRLKGIQVDLGLFGHADSLAVRRLVAWNGASPADSISLSGYISYGQFSDPRLNLRLDAKSFFAIDRRAFARLTVSTERGGLTLRGPLSGAAASGGVFIDKGVVFLPDPELQRKQGVDIRAQFADTASRDRSVLLDTRSRFLETIALTSVRVTLGDEVSLRSPEADIRLTGALDIKRVQSRIKSLTIGGVDTVQYQLAPSGTLRADRGTYTLNLLEGFRREFIVQSGGTIVFYEGGDLPAELNITAQHVVKRGNQADVRIRVHLTGPLTNPIVSLESGESYSLSQTDMVSYLAFGVPSFALGEGDNNTLQLVLQNVIPTLSAAFSTQLGRILPGNLQITAGAFDYSADRAGKSLGNLLFTTRVGGEWQLSDNVYLSASTGLCQLDRSSSASSENDLASGLSGKLEYRFNQTTALKAGREPPASALNCGKSVTGRAFIPTPSQWGLSLFKSWRF